MTFTYNCENCSIHTNIKQAFDKHLLSKRHAYLDDPDNQDLVFTCDICNKRFKRQSGLFNHNKKCVNVNPLLEPTPPSGIGSSKVGTIPSVHNNTIDNVSTLSGQESMNYFFKERVKNEKDVIDSSIQNSVKDIINMINAIKSLRKKPTVKNIVQDSILISCLMI